MDNEHKKVVEEVIKDYSSENYTIGKPIAFMDLIDLYIRPKQFFSTNVALGKTPYIIIITFFLGISNFIDQVDKNLLKARFGSRPGLEEVLSYVTESWLNFWIAALVFGAISGFFIWAIGGWWYKVRIRWSGDLAPDPMLARIVFIYSSFIYTLPAVLLVLIQTIFYQNYGQAFSADEYYSTIILIFPFWSVVVSYKEVKQIFNVTVSKARIWFLILPILVYIVAFGALGVLFAFLS